jgi:Tfp pilus assembly protein PilZ
MQEKRKFVRIQWPIVVQYKTLEEPYTKDQIVGTDISEGGISFIAYERFTKGTELDLQVQVPFDSMPIFAKGKVAWVKNVGEEHEKTFEVGIQFLKVDTRDQNRLKTYIDNEIRDKQDKTG